MYNSTSEERCSYASQCEMIAGPRIQRVPPCSTFHQRNFGGLWEFFFGNEFV